MTLRASLSVRKRALRALACSAIALAAGSCAQVYPAPNSAADPRVITAVATPVVASPGESFTVRPIYAGLPAGTRARFAVCVPPRQVPASQQPLVCFEQEALRVMGPVSAEAVTFDLPADMDTITRWVFTAYGTSTPVSQVFQSLQLNGLDLLVTIEVDGPNGVLRATKRLVMTISDMNAPTASVPAFRFAGQLLAPTATDPERCATSDGQGAVVAPGTVAEVDPEGLPSGTLSHYADGGTFAIGRSRPDLEEWTAPMMPGRTSHWLVIQRNVARPEGPAASSVAFCRFDVDVR